MKTLAELEEIRAKTLNSITLKDSSENAVRIVVGMATCGIAAGARPVMDEFISEIEKNNLSNVIVKQTGCIGMCRLEPMLDVIMPGGVKTTYVKVNPSMVARIVKEHIMEGKPVEEYTIGAAEGKTENVSENAAVSLENTEFFHPQVRMALRNCGVIDPENIDEYIALDGYKALEKALTQSTPDQVIQEVLKSGLRGRGGAGFPTGKKWQFAAASKSDQKYMVCNADEGDPGAFMDRSVLEGDPHSVLEAMTIGGYAIGANQGYIYCRAEYPIAVKRLEIAIKQAREYGLLGKNIFGSGFDFDISVRLGAGAFVCGEETALMHSIEGGRGEPKPKPPFPAVKGLFEKPTNINNVETFANIPQIILKGADWFRKTGIETSTGTKVFALGGKINNTGLVEVPMGTPLRDIIYKIGGGIPNGKAIKAVQTGGPSGGCIPAKLLDIQIDYDSLTSIGSMMGSGGMIVMDEDNCMVDIARFFLDFTVDESCGKCTPCRIGTRRMLEILERIVAGKGEDGDIEKLETLAKNIKATALCGLGQSAPNPVLSTIKYFRDEYEAHIYEKRCPAHHCRSLLNYVITDKCRGCTACARVCPVNAISGNVKEQHHIDTSKCIKCGSCMAKCRFDAIEKN